ncbi:hypothetical protein ACU4GD_36825 [Cupriavidus basilensis]
MPLSSALRELWPSVFEVQETGVHETVERDRAFVPGRYLLRWPEWLRG